jgi:hypothetical protein
MISHIASVLPWMPACLPAQESRKSMKANSDRRRPSSTIRALASLAVHPCRLAMRLSRFPLSAGKRMLMTVDWVAFKAISLQCNSHKYCSMVLETVAARPIR